MRSSLTILSVLHLSVAWGQTVTDGGESLAPGTSSDSLTSTSTDPVISDDVPSSFPSSTSSSSEELVTDVSSVTDLTSSVESITSAPESETTTQTPSSESSALSSTIIAEFYDDGSGEPEIPTVEPSPEEVVDLAAYEIETYAQKVVDGKISSAESPDNPVPVVLPICPDVSITSDKSKRGIFDGILSKPPPKPVFSCAADNLETEVHFVHVTNNTAFSLHGYDEEVVKKRVTANYSWLLAVFLRLDIRIKYGSYQVINNPAFSNHEVYNDAVNIPFMSKHRKPGNNVATIFIVSDITGEPWAGWSWEPNSAGGGPRADDGMVIKVPALTPSGSDPIKKLSEKQKPAGCAHSGNLDDNQFRGGTMIHEFGHWMGLRHTFAKTCKALPQDRVADTPDLSELGNTKCCYQTSCSSGDTAFRRYNWMSYSICRGISRLGNPWNYESFTDGQRSRMFAHYLKFRTGRNCAAPLKRDLGDGFAGSLDARSTLRKRDEQVANTLADLLLNNCSVAIQDVYQRDSIPLDDKVLSSYSSKASSLRANPTSMPGDMERPATINAGSGEPTAKNLGPSPTGTSGDDPSSTDSGDAEETSDKEGSGSLVDIHGGLVASIVAWVTYFVAFYYI